MNQHRAQLTQITGLAVSDATVYARSIADESPERIAAQVREASTAIVGAYSPVAAEGAALFYETQRPEPGRARLASPSIGGALAADLGVALLPLFTPAEYPDPVKSFLSGLGGVIQRHVAAGDRDTMLLSASNDPISRGVRRYARPGACAFCAYLASVVDVVDDDVTWHRNCHCVSVPWWTDNPPPRSEDHERWADAAVRAQKELHRMQVELKPPNMRRRNFFKAHPELAINTKNIVRLMRADLGLAH